MLDLKLGTLVLLFIFSLILIGLAYGTKASGGLFWSRSFDEYSRDREDPRFEKERQIGKDAADRIIKYVTPITLALFILLLLTLLKVI